MDNNELQLKPPGKIKIAYSQRPLCLKTKNYEKDCHQENQKNNFNYIIKPNIYDDITITLYE